MRDPLAEGTADETASPALGYEAASGEGLSASFVYDLRIGEVIATPAARALLGLPPASEITLAALLACLHADDRPVFAAAQGALVDDGSERAPRAECELRAISAGSERWLHAELRVLADDEGRTCGFCCVVRDVTRLKRAERALADALAERDALAARLALAEARAAADAEAYRLAQEQALLVHRELMHRIKNIFTVVSSLATLSARTMPEARSVAEALRARIEALGRAHDYVRPRGVPSEAAGEGEAPEQSVAGLLAALLAPYADEGEARLAIACDAARVGPHAATALALVVHELATNSVKYGALAVAGGRVRMSCSVEEGARAGRYAIVWTEEGGPPLDGPPTQMGFGTLLSQRAARAQLGAEIVHEWAREGLCVRLSIPIEKLAI
ncbi:HWE histidine kinase domain-containing protein [Salinarimonas sp.]|uniref:HWE histidine kinase domain-containing protein n=1 Tax=Salinarimonas sp. TaxID=2766526 RepID=UPI00391C468A